MPPFIRSFHLLYNFDEEDRWEVEVVRRKRNSTNVKGKLKYFINSHLILISSGLKLSVYSTLVFLGSRLYFTF